MLNNIGDKTIMKLYLVIARCADGDIAIGRKGVNAFSSYDDAVDVKKAFDSFNVPIDIVEYDGSIVQLNTIKNHCMFID